MEINLMINAHMRAPNSIRDWNSKGGKFVVAQNNEWVQVAGAKWFNEENK